MEVTVLATLPHNNNISCREEQGNTERNSRRWHIQRLDNRLRFFLRPRHSFTLSGCPTTRGYLPILGQDQRLVPCAYQILSLRLVQKSSIVLRTGLFHFLVLNVYMITFSASTPFTFLEILMAHFTLMDIHT
jgi:hypothetical protein